MVSKKGQLGLRIVLLTRGARDKRWINLRLRLNGHAPIQRNGVERVREAFLHVLLEVNAASRAGAFVVAARATNVTSRGGGISRGNTGGGAHGVIAFWWRGGVLAVGGVLGALGRDSHGHGVGSSLEWGRHDD